jgi:hypothetical protein
MTRFSILVSQMLIDYIALGLISVIYVYPRLVRAPLLDALTAIAFVHAFRFLGASYLNPALSGLDPGSSWALGAGFGDLTVSVLAVAAIVSMRVKAPWCMPLVWVLNIVGFADTVAAQSTGMFLHLWTSLTGVGWLISITVVPGLLIAHVLMTILLFRKRGGQLREIHAGRSGNAR